MPARRPILIFALRCGLTAALLSFASFAAWAQHTDDGCAVELHCFVCYWALATTAEAALPLHLGPALEPSGSLPAPELPWRIAFAAPARASRGPPSL